MARFVFYRVFIISYILPKWKSFFKISFFDKKTAKKRLQIANIVN